MKKLLIIATAAVSLSGLSVMGQGYFQFSGSTRGVWDAFTLANGGASKLGATMNVAFLWGSGSALVSSVSSSTATNGSTVFSPADAWTAILNDPNYTLAIDANKSTAAIASSAANGAWSYTSTAGTIFPVTGTGSGAYSVFVIGWDKTYATPADAAAANSAVGWSQVFSYTAANNVGTPLSMPASGLTPFGVIAPVPEPATFALAGLGAAALLVFRRKK